MTVKTIETKTDRKYVAEIPEDYKFIEAWCMYWKVSEDGIKFLQGQAYLDGAPPQACYWNTQLNYWVTFRLIEDRPVGAFIRKYFKEKGWLITQLEG